MEMTSVRLKRVREHLGLNQGGIAKKGGTIQSTWSNWEGGKLPEAFEVLKQLSTTYDLSTDYLLGLVDEPQGRVAGLSEAEERLLGLLRLLGPSQIDEAAKLMAHYEGKMGKERTVAMGDTAALALWAYMASWPGTMPTAPLFSTGTNNPLDRGNVEKLLKRIGDNAGVSDVHPHRFRHTFAVRYILNGGDVHTLRLMLGHETLEMAITYMHMAAHDVQAVQRNVSPADAVFNAGRKK